MTNLSADDVKHKAADLTTTIVEGAKEFKEEEVKSAGGSKAFIAGGVGGICTVLVGEAASPFLPRLRSSSPPPADGELACPALSPGHPFDLTKTRLQTAAPGTYTGAIDVVKKTLARDGVRGCVLSSSSPGRAPLATSADQVARHTWVRLYRGMGAPIVGVTPIFALSFWSYDLGKKLATSFLPSPPAALTATGEVSKELTLSQLAFAGFFSAIPTTLVTGPAERVKVLLQVRRSLRSR